MDFWILAYKNIRYHFQNYLAYFLSSTFAVLLFFLYASLLDHPELPWEKFWGLKLLGIVVIGIVVLFSVWFLRYSHRVFIQARNEEWALLESLGMPRKQRLLLLLMENGLMGLGAIAVGLFLGTVLMKLFYLFISYMLKLEVPITPRFSLSVTGWTVIIFGLMFAVISWREEMYMRSTSVKELMQNREGLGKGIPQPSYVLKGLALVTLTAGYVWIGQVESLWQALYWFVPCILLILTGTYLFYREVMIDGIQFLKRRRAFYYKGIYLLFLSRLSEHWRDHVRLLFMVTVMNILVLFGIGIFFSAFQEVDHMAVRQNPFSVSIVGKPETLPLERVEEILRKEELRVIRKEEIPVLKASQHDRSDSELAVVALSDFNRLLSRLVQTAPLKVKAGKGIYIFPYDGYQAANRKVRLSLGIGGQMEKVSVSQQMNYRVFNEHPLTGGVMILDDDTFSMWQKRYGKKAGTNIHGWVLANWKESGAAVEQMRQELGKEERKALADTPVEARSFLYQLFSPILFVSLFVSILFFLAACSLLYFRVFHHLPKEREQMKVLSRMGISRRNGDWLATLPILFFFFLPLAVSVLHSLAMLKFTEALVGSSVGGHMAGVLVGYGVLYSIYYRVTRNAYLKALNHTS